MAALETRILAEVFRETSNRSHDKRMAMPNDLELQMDRICNWLSQNAQYLETKGAIFELRADITSAATAALAQKSFGNDLLGLIISCHSSSEEIESAKLLAQNLGISYELVDLTDSFDLLANSLPLSSPESRTELMSRLRMVALYHYSKARNSIVLGTLSRSDWEIGNFTKYGDGAADFFPIIHLLKTELRALANNLNLPTVDSRKSVGTTEPDEIAGGITEQQLDAYLAGNHMHLPGNIQMKIQGMQQAAVSKKLPQFQSFLIEAPVGKGTASVEIQETYDKSIEALTLISKAITSDQYLEDILRLIVMVTAEVMNSSVCSLWLLDEKEGVMRLRATQSIDSEYLKDRVLRAGEGVVGKVVAENRPYIVSNVLTDPYYKEKELAKRMGLVSMLSVPMRVKERVIGVINCYTSHPHAFSDLQLNVLTTVANQAAVAIEKTELMVQTKVIQEELERRKIIERAKDLLMKRFHLPGEEAYRWLQKRSMNTRKSMREVAEAVILTMEG